MYVSPVNEQGLNVTDEAEGVSFHVMDDDGVTLAILPTFEAAQSWINERSETSLTKLPQED